MEKIKAPSNKSFAYTMAIAFALLALFFFIKENYVPSTYLLVTSLLFALIGYQWPKTLTPLNIFWFKLGQALAKVINPLVLSILYILLFTPVSLVRRLRAKHKEFYGRDTVSTSLWKQFPNNPWTKSKLKKQF